MKMCLKKLSAKGGQFVQGEMSYSNSIEGALS